MAAVRKRRWSFSDLFVHVRPTGRVVGRDGLGEDAAELCLFEAVKFGEDGLEEARQQVSAGLPRTARVLLYPVRAKTGEVPPGQVERDAVAPEGAT